MTVRYGNKGRGLSPGPDPQVEGYFTSDHNRKVRERRRARRRRRRLQTVTVLAMLAGTAAAYVVRDSMYFTSRSIPAGRDSTIRLPDGTSVDLTQGSRIHFRKALESQDKRIVELVGDATFAIAPIEGHPFVVYTRFARVAATDAGARVHVLATEAFTMVDVPRGNVTVEARHAGASEARGVGVGQRVSVTASGIFDALAGTPAARAR